MKSPKTSTCTRQWEAEAAIDDRLSDADKASFERHLSTCDVCQKEMRELEQLRDVSRRVMRGAGGEVSELEHRRQRADLLRLANNDLVLETGPKTGMLGVSLPLGRILAAVTFLCVVVAIVLVVMRRPQPPDAVLVPAPTFRMTTNDPWQRVETDSGQTVHVRAGESGHFGLEVDKLKSGQRFLVDLPDGELEVQGTRFEVTLEDGHTKNVRVFEGRVALRIRGEEARTLNANDAWDRPPPVTVAAPTASESPPPPPPPVTSSTPTAVRPTPSGSAPASALGAASVSASASASASSTAVGSDLASAMDAFTLGDYARAETLFLAFAKTHPNDARAEDAAFLIAVSREKRGDHEGARTAAREYLRRYPTGFRRKEAEKLAAD